MSNSGRRAAVYTCVCLCVHILVFAHNLNQYTQEGGIKATCRRQKLQKQTSCTQCSVNSTILSISATNNSFNVCLFLPQDTIPLFSVCLLETINLQLLPVALLSSFQFFFFFFQWELSSLTFVRSGWTAAGNKDRRPITDLSEWPWVCEPHS